MLSLSALNGIFEKIGVGLTMSRRLTDPPIQIMVALAGGIPFMIYMEYLICTEVGVVVRVDTFRRMADDMAYDKACLETIKVGCRECL